MAVKGLKSVHDISITSINICKIQITGLPADKTKKVRFFCKLLSFKCFFFFKSTHFGELKCFCFTLDNLNAIGTFLYIIILIKE